MPGTILLSIGTISIISICVVGFAFTLLHFLFVLWHLYLCSLVFMSFWVTIRDNVPSLKYLENVPSLKHLTPLKTLFV